MITAVQVTQADELYCDYCLTLVPAGAMIYDVSLSESQWLCGTCATQLREQVIQVVSESPFEG